MSSGYAANMNGFGFLCSFFFFISFGVVSTHSHHRRIYIRWNCLFFLFSLAVSPSPFILYGFGVMFAFDNRWTKRQRTAVWSCCLKRLLHHQHITIWLFEMWRDIFIKLLSVLLHVACCNCLGFGQKKSHNLFVKIFVCFFFFDFETQTE